jgi:hypothetical protein
MQGIKADSFPQPQLAAACATRGRRVAYLGFHKSVIPAAQSLDLVPQQLNFDL